MRSIACLVAASLAAICILVQTTAPANAYNTLYCRFDGTNAKFFVAQNDAPTTGFEAAGDEWEVGTSGITVSKVTTESNRNVYAFNLDLNYTGWTGILDHYDEVGGSAPPCQSSGHWNYNKIAVIVNTDTYFSYMSNSTLRKGVAIHEFGHFLGLAHNGANLGCPGGGLKAAAIMYPNDDRFFGDCGITLPQSDDKAGINALY